MSEEPDFSDPGWGQVSLLGAEIEVNVRDELPLHSFALHVRGSDRGAADAFVARLLASIFHGERWRSASGSSAAVGV